MKPLALIVDDEPDIRELLEITLSRMGVDTRTAGTLGEAYGRLEGDDFALCLADMRLPDGNGIELVRRINERYPQTPVAVITAHGNMETAVTALKAGAFDFVSKPVDLPVLRGLVETALRLSEGTDEQPRTAVQSSSGSRLLGNSAVMTDIRNRIAKLARSQAPVAIGGESGTGKELAARQIHELGPRAAQPFVAVNCGAIPQELMESEFFGHVKGSFTGAIRDKPGLFQSANGGTLFLDEVADLPLPMQVKLLRAIQEKTVRPVGAAGEERVDVRLISATHKDLPALVAAGHFRQDLYYRINVIDLRMPNLRERPEDVPILIDYFLSRLSAQMAIDKPRIDRDALKRLKTHSFSGNVRELENILERAVALCEDDLIRTQDLGLTETPDESLAEPGPDLVEDNGKDLEQYLADVEKQAIVQALEATRWNRTAAAKKLGISFRALRYRLEKLGLD